MRRTSCHGRTKCPGTAGPQRHIYLSNSRLPPQVEGAVVVLHQVAVGTRSLDRGWRDLVLGDDQGGGPQLPQA